MHQYLEANAKLTAKIVRKIRKLLMRGQTQKEIAVIVGCSQSNISDINRGRIWGHVR